MMATFTAAAIQSAFAKIAEDLHVSIERASYQTSLVIAILGGAPLFWRPLSDRYGRRPIFLLSLICSLIGNVGCAKSPSYGTMGLCRAITAFFISPAAAIGSAVVQETFFKHERARYMGIWTYVPTLLVSNYSAELTQLLAFSSRSAFPPLRSSSGSSPSASATAGSTGSSLAYTTHLTTLSSPSIPS